MVHWRSKMSTRNPMAVGTVLHRFLHDDSAATAIEYGLIASLIAVAIIAGATALGTSINTTFDNLSTKMD